MKSPFSPMLGTYVLGVLTAACVIYGSQARLLLSCGSANARLLLHQIPNKDYFYTQDTFSETEAARRVIQAECRRFLTTYQVELDLLIHPFLNSESEIADKGSDSDEQKRSFETKWRPRLLERLAAYKGWPEEHLVLNEYLRFLRRFSSAEEVLEVYWKALHRTPGALVVGIHALDALKAAAELGRSQPLIEELQRVLTKPVKLESQDSIRTALATWRSQNPKPTDDANNVSQHQVD